MLEGDDAGFGHPAPRQLILLISQEKRIKSAPQIGPGTKGAGILRFRLPIYSVSGCRFTPFSGADLGRDAHATVEAHRSRWRVFADYCDKIGIKDARCITLDILSAFGVHLRGEVDEDKMEVAYAQNLLSSANVVLECLRGDRKVSVRPAGLVGKRRIVRTVMPKGDREALARAVAVLNDRGHIAAAFAVQFSREVGLRLREACLLGLETALEQALATGKIDVREGTKGGRGRNVERLVPATERMIELLRMAQGLGTRNLIPAG